MFAGFEGIRQTTVLLGVKILAHVVIECGKDAVKVVEREHPGVVVHWDIQEIEYSDVIKWRKLAADA